MWKTRKDFDRDFFNSYRTSKFKFGDKIAPIGAALLRAKPKKNKPPRNVSIALSILDDLVLDAVFWTHLLSQRLLNTRRFRKRPNFRRSIFALLMKVSQDAMVVRNLAVDGYDVQARNLLRSIDEHVDALYYLCLRPEVCDEFVLTNDSESANKFWWQHIRRARTVIDAELQRRLKSDLFLEFSQFKQAERHMFSTAHHPSYVASTVPFLVPYESANALDYLFGIPNEYSYRTGRFLFFILAEMSMMIGFLDADIKQLIENRRGGPLQEFVRKGRQHMVQMLLLLTSNKDSAMFSNSKSMEDYIETLPE